jgi:hypothetical protein
MNYKKLTEMDERERKSYSKAYMNSVSAINSMNGEVFSGRWSSRYAETLAQAFESVGYYVTIVEIESYDNYAVWVRKNSYSDFFKDGGQVRKLSREDYDGDMAKAQLQKIETYAAKLNEMIHPQDELEAWVQAKLSVVAAYMGDVKHYLDYELQKIGEGEVEEKEEKEYVGPYKEGGITESHSDQMIDIMNKDRESEARMYRVKPSTTAEDMLEAREMLGMAKWNKLSREEKKELVSYLKLKGDIGHFGQEEDIETVSGMQYYMAKGGEIYKIQQKYKYELQPKWEDEKFQTGGRKFLSFKDAQDFKKKLSDMTCSMEYKVVKVEDKMRKGIDEYYKKYPLSDDNYAG